MARHHFHHGSGPEHYCPACDLAHDHDGPCTDDRCGVDHVNIFTDGELDDIARSIVGLFFGTHTDVVQSRALAAVHRRFRGAAPDTSVDGVRPDDRADMQPAADDR